MRFYERSRLSEHGNRKRSKGKGNWEKEAGAVNVHVSGTLIPQALWRFLSRGAVEPNVPVGTLTGQ